MNSIPKWLKRYIEKWVDRLRIDEYTLRIELVRVIENEETIHGLTRQQADYLHAGIELLESIEDTPEWRVIVIHELLHVFHAQVDYTVDSIIIPQLPEAQQDISRNIYHAETERLTVTLSRILYAMTREEDFPPKKPSKTKSKKKE